MSHISLVALKAQIMRFIVQSDIIQTYTEVRYMLYHCARGRGVVFRDKSMVTVV